MAHHDVDMTEPFDIENTPVHLGPYGTAVVLEPFDGTVVRHEMSAGRAAVNPAGVWHTADVNEVATVLFVTPGAGTVHRPR